MRASRPLLLICSCIIGFGCYTGPVEQLDEPLPRSAEEIQEALVEAYQDHSRTRKDVFFRQWDARSIPVSTQEREAMDDTVRAVYDLFEAYFDPVLRAHQLDLEKKWKGRLSRPRYYVIGDRLHYRTVERMLDASHRSLIWSLTRTDSLRMLEQAREDSIANFRPDVSSASHGIVYLDENYRQALRAFLGDEHTPFAEGGIMSPAIAAGESEKRAAWLRSHMDVLVGHWGGHWHLETFPRIGRIDVQRDLKRAVVHFRFGYQGGRAFFERKDGAWSLESEALEWIE